MNRFVGLSKVNNLWNNFSFENVFLRDSKGTIHGAFRELVPRQTKIVLKLLENYRTFLRATFMEPNIIY